MDDERVVKVVIEQSFTSNDANDNERIRTPSNTSKLKSKIDSFTNTYVSNFIINQSKSIIKEESKYWLDRKFNLEDDYVSQRNVNIASNIINRAIGDISSVASATLIAGPVGFVVSSIAVGVGLITDIVKNYQQQSDNIRIMNNQLNFSRVRSGYSLTAGSIGENL